MTAQHIISAIKITANAESGSGDEATEKIVEVLRSIVARAERAAEQERCRKSPVDHNELAL
jgi:hypothetical protein